MKVKFNIVICPKCEKKNITDERTIGFSCKYCKQKLNDKNYKLESCNDCSQKDCCETDYADCRFLSADKDSFVEFKKYEMIDERLTSLLEGE